MKCKATMLALIFAFALSVCGFQKASETPGLYPVKVNGKYGFIDASGKIVISPTYEDAQPFQEDLSCVRVGSKYGFIDPEGHLVIQPQFDQTLSFSEDLAGVKVAGRWGFINKSGQMVIEPQYKFALSFSQRLASVSSGKVSGYIDKTGKMVFTLDPMASGSSFSEGFAGVSVGLGKKEMAYFINPAGQRAFPSTYYMVNNFYDGLANVSKDRDKVGYIDRTGKLVIPFQAGAASRFSEGLAAFDLPNDRVVYIDKTGKTVITGNFGRAEPFSEGLAAVQLKTDPNSTRTVNTPNGTVKILNTGWKYGYIDKTGKVVIPAQFEDAGQFIGGLARVCRESTAAVDFFGNKKPCGYIDATGKFVWPPSQ